MMAVKKNENNITSSSVAVCKKDGEFKREYYALDNNDSNYDSAGRLLSWVNPTLALMSELGVRIGGQNVTSNVIQSHQNIESGFITKILL